MEDMGVARWSVSGDSTALRDVAVDFIDGVDASLDALNARGAKVLVRAAEITISYPAREDEAWIVEAFTRRHPDVTVTVLWDPDQGTPSGPSSTWSRGRKMSPS